MDKLIFLGTGHALAYHCYSTCLALTDGTHTFMTDAGSGNGVLLQMERAGLTSDDITDLFISHRHTDHLIGASVTALTAVAQSPSLSTEKRACWKSCAAAAICFWAQTPPNISIKESSSAR